MSLRSTTESPESENTPTDDKPAVIATPKNGLGRVFDTTPASEMWRDRWIALKKTVMVSFEWIGGSRESEGYDELLDLATWLMAGPEFRCVDLEDKDDYSTKSFEWGLRYPNESKREQATLLLRPFGKNELFSCIYFEGGLHHWCVNCPIQDIRNGDGIISEDGDHKYNRRHANVSESYTLSMGDTRKKIMELYRQ